MILPQGNFGLIRSTPTEGYLVLLSLSAVPEEEVEDIVAEFVAITSKY
jgi:hypothetical protein